MEKVECEVEAFKRFAFGLGEIVCLQQDVANTSDGGWVGGLPRDAAKMKIVSRHLVEDCTGSVMHLYSVRGFKQGVGVDVIVHFQELELCTPPIHTSSATNVTASGAGANK